MTKAQARAIARALWRQWDAAALRDLGTRMADELFSLPLWKQAGTVFCFVPMPGEPDLTPVLEAALAQGKRLLVPRVRGARMEPVAITRLDELTPGAYGIREPAGGTAAAPETLGADTLALIPCLAAGPNGVRLGRGGGYYDRYLEGTTFLRAALCWQQMMEKEIPVDIHDQRMDVVITENDAIRTRD